jgi:hypothetical protein
MVPTRILLSIAEFIWGTVLLIESGYNGYSANFAQLVEVLPLWLWGIFFLSTSVLHFCTIVTETFHTTLAKIFALWVATLWVTVVITMIFSTYPPQANLAGETALMLGAVWIWLRPIILTRGIARARDEVA